MPHDHLRVLAHPLRMRILSLLTGTAMSAAEAARELGDTQANISYHLRRLHEAGLVDVAEEVQIRGGRAKRYRHHPDSGRRLTSRDPGEEQLLTKAIAGELLRRAELRAPARPASLTDAELWVDPDWYAVQSSADPCPSPGLPAVVGLSARSVLVGRPSTSRNIHPEIDCEPDSGASRRQCQLTTDGTRWWVEDLESANGTFVAGASDPLPGSPIPVGLKQEIQPGDRVYVGAWTRIVVRAATPDEQEALT